MSVIGYTYFQCSGDKCCIYASFSTYPCIYIFIYLHLSIHIHTLEHTQTHLIGFSLSSPPWVIHISMWPFWTLVLGEGSINVVGWRGLALADIGRRPPSVSPSLSSVLSFCLPFLRKHSS